MRPRRLSDGHIVQVVEVKGRDQESRDVFLCVFVVEQEVAHSK